jgi:hypothetical protein
MGNNPSPSTAEARLRSAFSAIPSILLLAGAGYALRALRPGADFRTASRVALSFIVTASAAPYAAHSLQCLREVFFGFA